MHTYISGPDRTENLRTAARAFTAVASKTKNYPSLRKQWAIAKTQHAVALAQLPRGDRVEDLRKAVRFLESGLEDLTREEDAADWGIAANNLGIIYEDLGYADTALTAAERSKYLEVAASAYQEATVVLEKIQTSVWSSIARANLDRVRKVLESSPKAPDS